MGNPTRYMIADTSATPNMVWSQGRKLKSGSLNGNNFSYRYDANGMRYEKTVNGTTTKYNYLEGDRIMAEQRPSETLYYHYDGTGISGFTKCTGTSGSPTTYYYKKNIQRDIVAVLDSAGSIVASYTYDAWGNVTIGTNTSSIATLNPFRYRGYYQDNETGFYYLQSRFYDPVIRRFISQDTPSVIGQLVSVPGQMNLYAYCGNNPVAYIDPSGYSATATMLWLLFLQFLPVIGQVIAIIALVAIIVTAVIYVIATNWDNITNWVDSKGFDPTRPWTGDNTLHIDKSGKVTPPSWVVPGGYEINPNESPTQNADRIMKERYGENFGKGPKSEHNWIKKWIEWLRGGRGRGGRGGPSGPSGPGYA